MTSRPSAHQQGPSTAQVRRRLLAIALGLLLPVPLIWLGAAVVVAHGLQFPPALAYSTSGAPSGGQSSANAGAAPLRESLGVASIQVTLKQGHEPLRALVAPAAVPSAAVVLVYPNAINSQALLAYFRIIHAAGYGALIIDYRGASPRYGLGWAQRGDVIAAVKELRKRGAKRVAVMGVSEGAAAALYAAAQDAPIDAIIADSSYADLSRLLRRIPPLDSLNPLFTRTVLWELGLKLGRPICDIAPRQAAAQIDRPLMVIGGADDPLTPPADARAIFAGARGPKELWIAPHAGHAAALASDPSQYTDRVGGFMRRYVGAAAP